MDERSEQYLKPAPLQITEPSTCASCGDTFGCGAKFDGCWCTELTVSEAAAAEIGNDFDGCLCPKCLGVFALRPEKKPAYTDRPSTELIK